MTTKLPRPHNPAAKILHSVMAPLQQFLHQQTAGGIVLLVVTAFTLWWANSAYSELYFHFLHLPVGLRFGEFVMEKSLQHWVNDALMVVFFFVVGLEIKKELLQGELANFRRAALPIFGALGGMVLPALIYAFFNQGTPTSSGWGIPMATDIAFAIGVVSLLGKRVPFALMVFLLALAIVDDLGAVLVIALFYTKELSVNALGFAAVGIMLTVLLKYAGVRHRLVYFILAIGVWFAVFSSGVHATVAGVVLGFLTPITPLISRDALRRVGFDLLKTAEDENIAELRQVAYEALSPADSWIRNLHPWVTFLIMPLFALTNAGVQVAELDWSAFWSASVTLGVFFGLLAGKAFGVFGFSWLACRLGLAVLPRDVNWRQMFGVSCLAGIGFTMALFISHLSLTDELAGDFSKLAILLASLTAAILGSVILSAYQQSLR